MELNSEVVLTPPRNAATVVLLRDTPSGMEVFLVKRHGLSDVLGGAYVFPGGKLDDADTELDDLAHMDTAAHTLHAALHEPQTPVEVAKGLYVAALREAFEESGVLFGTAGQAGVNALAAQRMKAGQNFNDILAELGIRLQTQAVVPWSRWITPLMPSVTNKRFDTRFFVALVPRHQTAQHDNVETTQSVWIKPADALAQYWNYEIEMAPPQLMTLSHLSRFPDAESAIASARVTPPPLILPHAFDERGTRVICYPGDPEHSVVARAMPGPTRLMFLNKRFEPAGGLSGWLT
jgi:8-oxo-dGTP pyrophosphatase MutT (NUDIX family)